jgi:pimeloyl-ACP methyl ester carboxylesterase
VDPASCAALEQRLPGCEVRRMPGIGHLPFEEAPEGFNRVVMEFLESA